MNKTSNPFKNRSFRNIFIPWTYAFVFLFFYYLCVQFPMEKAFVKGLNFLKQNKPTEASNEFSKVLKVYPKYEPVYLNIANYSLKNGQINDYKERYQYAFKLSLINSEIFSERGLVYAKYKNDLAKGVDFYNEHVLKNYTSNLFYDYAQK